jgi:hypothetical protein
MVKTVTTSVKVSKQVSYKVLQKVIGDGYGMRGKSKWIVEAIEWFLTLPNYRELTEIAGDMEELTETFSLRLPETVMIKIDNALIDVRELYPALEGVRSNIIRSSIVQRLIRG